MRPWGLAAPVGVLLVCLPLLRPLLHPGDLSDNERERLAVVQAMVERGEMKLEYSAFPGGARDGPAEPKQPPVMAALLYGPYWVMYKAGLSFKSSPTITPYVLTLLGCTLPVAGAAGLVYRMGRLFELTRPWRMLLAVAAVFGSGLVSYATVLNSHAPAAALLLAACGCLLQSGTTRSRPRARSWVMLAGFAAGLAGVIDLGALAFVALFLVILGAMRWTAGAKVAAAFSYLLGVAGPVALHCALTIPITGDVRPGFLHEHSARTREMGQAIDEDDVPSRVTIAARNFADGVLGPHGLLSHFPVLLFGVGGISAVLHRHWPAATKAFAVVTLAGALAIVGAYVVLDPDWTQPMFSTRWFIVFVPLLVFWAGAWLRRNHHPVVWAGAAVVLAFSMVASMLGAAAPFPPPKRAGQHEYTVVSAGRMLIGVGTAGNGRVAVAAPRLRED